MLRPRCDCGDFCFSSAGVQQQDVLRGSRPPFGEPGFDVTRCAGCVDVAC